MDLTQILIYAIVFIVSASIDLSLIFKFRSVSLSKAKKLELAKILKSIPGLIKDAEQYIGSGNGYAKLNFVLNKLHIMCIEKGLDYDEKGFTYEIESILATPQKKEVIANGKETCD